MAKPLFVILHGSYGSPESNWFPVLKQRLERLGQEAVVPRLPTDAWDEVLTRDQPIQTLDSWLEAADSLISKMSGRQVVIVGHSLGPLFLLQLIEKHGINIDCLIAVSPFLDLDTTVTPEQINISNKTFYKSDIDFEKIKQHIGTSYVLYSENDPYVPMQKSQEFAQKLGAAPIMVRGAGHMNAEINMNEFPLVLELCKSRIDLTLYQKYVDHRAELFSEDTAKYHTEAVVQVAPKDIVDEGIFKFRNLRKHGFCTLPTNAALWDSESNYMKEARMAAQRLGTITRVFLVDKTSDLERASLHKQITLDLESGIQVYLCPLEAVANHIGAVDFGIWDDEYVCIVTHNDGPEPEVLLTSRQTDIPQAKDWQDIILENATKVTNEQTLRGWIEKHPA